MTADAQGHGRRPVGALSAWATKDFAPVTYKNLRQPSRSQRRPRDGPLAKLPAGATNPCAQRLRAGSGRAETSRCGDGGERTRLRRTSRTARHETIRKAGTWGGETGTASTHNRSFPCVCWPAKPGRASAASAEVPHPWVRPDLSGAYPAPSSGTPGCPRAGGLFSAGHLRPRFIGALPAEPRSLPDSRESWMDPTRHREQGGAAEGVLVARE